MKKIYNRDIVTRDYISNRKRKDRWLGLLTMCLLFVIGTSGFAQVSAYTFIHSEETYESIVEDGVLVPDSEATNAIVNDAAGWLVTIPFGFNFNSINYTSIYVNSNGGATFGATNSTSSSLISSSTAYSGAISVMNRDLWGLFVTSGVTTSGSNIINNVGSFRGIAVGKVLNAVNGIPSNTTITAFDVNAQTITMSNNATSSAASAVIRYGTGKIFTKVEGNAPNRIFTIQWEGYNDYGTTTSTSNYLSFQLKLAETSNTIKIVYGDYYNLSTTSRTNQIGLRGATNSDYNNRTGTVTNPWTSTANGTSNSATVARNNENFPASGLTFTWTAPVAEAVPNCIALPTAPANNAVNIVSNTFTWPAAAGLPNGYRFYLGTDEEATDLINGEDIGAVLTYNAASITLSPGTQYYWRAVAYNDFGDAESCTIWSFTTAPVPNCATGHSPADLATAVARNPTLTWTAPTSPSASSYDIYIGTSPNPAFVTNVTSASYISPLLAANTTYYWKVIPKNASGSATGCIERSFTTGPDIVYCTPASTGNGTYIDNFSTTLGTTNISNLTSGYTTGGYQNNFSSTAVTSFVGGSFNYNFTIVGGTLGAAIWIDWNSNGTFETGEKVFVTSGYGSGPYAGTITIPGGTALGDYRMRVMVDYNNSAPSNPCMTANARTETEDYKITVGAAPSCLAPTALASSNIATTTATLSWTASTSNPTNGYDVYYSTTNTAPLAGTTPTVNNHTASPLNATGLTSASTYYWWVRSDCGAETSAWASGGSFTTLCDLVTTFSQNWDGVAANALPVCFNKVGTLGSVYAQAGSTSSGANTLYIYASNSSSEPTLALQPVSNAGAGTHWLKFKLRANFTVGGKLQVGYLTNPTDETSFVMIQEFIANSITTYEEFKCIPGTLPGSNTTLALRAKGSPAISMLVDDLVWELTPSCLSPSLFSSSNLTASTATLNWTASNSNPTNGYDIYYNTVNTAPLVDTMPTINNQTGVSANLADLTSATTYFWWIRSDCGAETSSWATGGSFTTLCNAVSIPTNLETFESSNSGVPVCWSTGLVSGTENWDVATGDAGDIEAAYAGSNFMEKNYTSSDAILISFPIDYSSITNSTRINTYLHRHASAHANDQYKIYINTSPSLTGATEIFSLYSKTSIAPTVAATGWYNYTINIPTSFNGQSSIYVIFEGITTAGFDSYDLGIDDFKVEITPCPEWTGAISTAWNVAGNWCDNTVPSALTNVIINSANPAIISTDVTVASMTLGASANVTVNATLNVGNITVASGGMMTVANDAAILQTNGATNSGQVTVKRNSTDLFRQDYTLWSSPVSGQNLRAFSSQTLFNRFSSYDTAAGTNGAYLQEIVTTADMNTKTFTNAKGYLIRMPNNWVEVGGTAQPYLGSFTGTLNNGAVSIPLSGANSKLNLVGNPYASPISISTFFGANSDIVNNTLYFWRKKGSENSVASGYATYTSLGIVSADASINGTTPTNIEVGQGFFVIANSVTPGNLVFNNTMRNNGAATFYKSSNDNTAELHRFWLNLSNATNVVGQTLIGYKTGATQGIDAGVDALYFNDSATALTSLIDNSEYIIQGKNVPFVDTDIVPLGFKSDVSGSFTIGLSNFDGLFAENQDIFLKDNVTGALHNLKLSDYTFTTSIGVFNNRFEVQYSSTLGTNNPELAGNTILIGVKDQKININAGTITMDKIELIDVAGRVIYTQEGVNATTTTLENVVSSNQMLIVRISTKENGVVNKKIIF